jgi:glycosyltransferase involved in cell wall biosynthesis
MRVVGASAANLAGWRDPSSGDKWSPFFRALDRELEVVEVLPAQLPLVERVANRALGRAGRAPIGGLWHSGPFQRRTMSLERQLRGWDGRFDVIVQLQTLCAPGIGARPYAICTDSTHALLERHDLTAAPIPARRAREWQRREREVAQGAGLVLTWSEFARRSFVDDYHCPPERVVASGAGANLLASELPDRRGRRPSALFVGYEFERKGGRVLLDAWAEVERRVPDAELVIAGPRAPVSSTATRVRWTGRASRGGLTALYRDASVFVLPSLFEPFGLALLEAMGQGLPCVATNCCAMPELVQDGINGALVPRGDPDALAEALVALLTDTEQAAAMGRAGHAAVRARHTWEHVGERMARELRTAFPAIDAAHDLEEHVAPAARFRREPRPADDRTRR